MTLTDADDPLQGENVLDIAALSRPTNMDEALCYMKHLLFGCFYFLILDWNHYSSGQDLS